MGRTEQVESGALWLDKNLDERNESSWHLIAISKEALDFINESLVIRSRFSSEEKIMENCLDLKRDLEDISQGQVDE